MGRLQANVEYNAAIARRRVCVYRAGAAAGAARGVGLRWSTSGSARSSGSSRDCLVKALEDASQVANMRYEGGVSSYLEVLDTERQLFDAEIQLVQAKRDE